MLITVFKGGCRFRKAHQQMLNGWMMTSLSLVLLAFTTPLQASPTTNTSDNNWIGHSSFQITQEPTKSLRFIAPELVAIEVEFVRPQIASAISTG